MNIAPDPKSLPKGSILSPEPNQAAALAADIGVLIVDLDAIVANWRKLEKTGVPAECAGVVKANAYGCGAEQVARALSNAGCKTFFVATLDEARVVRAAVPPTAAIYVLDGFFQNSGDAYELCRHISGSAIPVRPGAAGRRAVRRQPDAGGRQSDAAGGRAQGAHRADPHYRTRRDRRIRRHLDGAPAD